jgi:membrane-bound ClpP family serine protease
MEKSTLSNKEGRDMITHLTKAVIGVVLMLLAFYNHIVFNLQPTSTGAMLYLFMLIMFTVIGASFFASGAKGMLDSLFR